MVLVQKVFGMKRYLFGVQSSDTKAFGLKDCCCWGKDRWCKKCLVPTAFCGTGFCCEKVWNKSAKGGIEFEGYCCEKLLL